MAAKLHLALDALPDFARLPAELAGERLVIAPDLVYLEQAFDHCEVRPVLAGPGARDHHSHACTTGRSRPPGKHVLSAIVQYAPFDARASGDGAAARASRAQRSACSSATRRACAGRSSRSELLMPADIEREFRITGGHWHHGELALDQFLMLRPVPGRGAVRDAGRRPLPVRRRLPSGRRRHGLAPARNAAQARPRRGARGMSIRTR